MAPIVACSPPKEQPLIFFNQQNEKMSSFECMQLFSMQNTVIKIGCQDSAIISPGKWCKNSKTLHANVKSNLLEKERDQKQLTWCISKIKIKGATALSFTSFVAT